MRGPGRARFVASKTFDVCAPGGVAHDREATRRRRHRRGPRRARRGCPSRLARDRAAGLRGRRRGRREHPGVGPRAGVLAVGVQRRPGRRRTACGCRLGGAAGGRVSDRVGHRRALPRAARGAAGDRAGAAPRCARDRRDAARDRQAQGRRSRRRAVRAGRRGARRGAAVPGVGGDRRVGHVDAAEPARGGRRAGARRAGRRRPDLLRDPGCARRRSCALRGPARAGRGQRPLGVQRDPRSRHASRLGACDGDRVGDPRLGARPQVRRRRRRPAARAGRARRGGSRARRRRLGRAGRRLPDPPGLARRTGASLSPTRTSRSRPTRSSRRPGSARICRCWASCGSTSTTASRRRGRSLR